MKTSKAFTLIEAMVALVIGVMALFWASNMNIGSLGRLQLLHEKSNRLSILKEKILFFFIQPPARIVTPKIEHLNFPQFSYSCGYEEIAKKSSLHTVHDRIRKVRAHGTWKRGMQTSFIDLVTFVPAPLESKEQ